MPAAAVALVASGAALLLAVGGNGAAPRTCGGDGWVFDTKEGALSADSAVASPGYELVCEGADRGLLISNDGARVPVRRAGATAEASHDSGHASSARPAGTATTTTSTRAAPIETAAPGTTVPPKATLTRFLLYDTHFGMSFAEQIEVLFVALQITSMLNKEDCSGSGQNSGTRSSSCWTLVLPPWCSVVHWYHEAAGAGTAWNELFAVTTLGREVPIMEFEALLRQADFPGVDLAVLPAVGGARSAASGPKGEEFAGWSQHLRDCEQLGQPLPQYADRQGRKALVYSGYCDASVLVTDFRCGVLRQASPRAVVDMLKKASKASAGAAVRSVLLKHLDGAHLHSPAGAAAQLYQPALRPTAELRAAAESFVKRTLGRLEYLAAHLRRNEFVQSHPDTTPSAAAAAARLNFLLEKHGLEQVFVATDALPGFRDELRRRVKGALYYFTEDDDAVVPEHKGKEEVIVLQVLALARHFIGSHGSAFSAWVRRERRHLGKSPASSDEVFCGKQWWDHPEHRCRAPSAS